MKKLIKLICNSVGLAMGVAVIVLSILKKIDNQDGLYMLGIGIICIFVSTLIKDEIIKEEQKEEIKNEKTKTVSKKKNDKKKTTKKKK